MIRHTVLFRWSAEATDEQKLQAAEEVAKLPSIVPTIRAFTSGNDAGYADGNFDFAVSADFDDEAGYFAYRDDQAHRDMIARYIVPILGQRAAVQFRY
jgi:hypothetical protein